MGLFMVIGGTVVLVTFFAGFFDYLGKRTKGGGKELEARLAALEQRLGEQDQSGLERDEQVRRLQGEVAFMTHLLEQRAGQSAGTTSAGG